MGVLHEDKYTFMIIPRSVPLRMRHVSDKSCRENQQNFCVQGRFFEIRVVYKIMGKKILLNRTGHRHVHFTLST